MGGIEVGWGSGGYVPVAPVADPYTQLSVYNGKKSECDHCKRAFASGEVVSQSEDLVFCYSDAYGGCLSGYVFTHGVMLIGNPVRFGEVFLPEDKRTPNYPNTPILGGELTPVLTTESKSGFWQRMKSLFV